MKSRVFRFTKASIPKIIIVFVYLTVFHAFPQEIQFANSIESYASLKIDSSPVFYNDVRINPEWAWERWRFSLDTLYSVSFDVAELDSSHLSDATVRSKPTVGVDIFVRSVAQDMMKLKSVLIAGVIAFASMTVNPLTFAPFVQNRNSMQISISDLNRELKIKTTLDIMGPDLGDSKYIPGLVLKSSGSWIHFVSSDIDIWETTPLWLVRFGLKDLGFTASYHHPDVNLQSKIDLFSAFEFAKISGYPIVDLHIGNRFMGLEKGFSETEYMLVLSGSMTFRPLWKYLYSKNKDWRLGVKAQTSIGLKTDWQFGQEQIVIFSDIRL